MLKAAVMNFEFPEQEAPASKVLGMDRRNWITKRPLDLFDLESICKSNRYQKELLLVILIRDIRSILTSFHRLVPDDYFIAYDFQYFVNRATGTILYQNPGVIPIHQAIMQALQNQNFKKKLVLKYEDIVRSPGKQQEYLGKALNLEYKDKFDNFHKNGVSDRLSWALNDLRPVDESRIEGWRKPEHAHRIRSQFTRCPALFDILIQYGYEKDRSWFEPYKRNEPPRF